MRRRRTHCLQWWKSSFCHGWSFYSSHFADNDTCVLGKLSSNKRSLFILYEFPALLLLVKSLLTIPVGKYDVSYRSWKCSLFLISYSKKLLQLISLNEVGGDDIQQEQDGIRRLPQLINGFSEEKPAVSICRSWIDSCCSFYFYNQPQSKWEFRGLLTPSSLWKDLVNPLKVIKETLASKIKLAKNYNSSENLLKCFCVSVVVSAVQRKIFLNRNTISVIFGKLTLFLDALFMLCFI